MIFRLEQDSDPRTLRVVGELDISTADDLVKQLEPFLSEPGDLHLDLGDLEFMDSSGIYALIRLSQQLGGRGRVVLRSPTGEVGRVLHLVRADHFPNLVVEGEGTPLRHGPILECVASIEVPAFPRGSPR